MPRFGNPSGAGRTRKDPLPSSGTHGPSDSARFQPAKHATATRLVKDSRDRTGFVEARHGQFKVVAKVFDEPSVHGIRHGRVSKLEIRDAEGRVVYNYDRGVDPGVPKGGIDPTTVRNIVRNLDRLPPPRPYDDRPVPNHPPGRY